MDLKVEDMDFHKFKSIARHTYESELLLRDKIQKLIDADIQAVHISCPCGENGTCANVHYTIPIIQNKYGLEQMNNSVTKRKLLVDDIARVSETCTGKVVYFKDEPVGFFLLTDNVILRVIIIKELRYLSEVFAVLKDKEYYIYTTTEQSILENVSGLLATPIIELDKVPITERCADKKLFRLT